jgi:hypothetical protein
MLDVASGLRRPQQSVLLISVKHGQNIFGVEKGLTQYSDNYELSSLLLFLYLRVGFVCAIALTVSCVYARLPPCNYHPCVLLCRVALYFLSFPCHQLPAISVYPAFNSCLVYVLLA